MNKPAPNGLSKQERIHGKTDISTLLAKGRYGLVPGLKYCYLKDNGLDHPRMMVAVSKRFFKRAVKRNLLKRRIREAYRLLKHNMPQSCDLFIMYNTKEVMDSAAISASVAEIISNLRPRGNGQAEV